ncbi:MAG: hypothetical protein EOO60_03030 [Hymenobacter sp.]|nr:MAG: hypothetical protein EOO60_03030 [Hymenobacter sp.]
MRTRFVLFTTLTLGVLACKKEGTPSLPAPLASFSFVGTNAPDVLTVGTYDPIQVSNQSTNAVSYRWSLGNDSTKTGLDPGLLRYPKAGTYTLSLTTKNASGQQASCSRTVKVLDRVIKQVILVGTRFENTSPPHAFSDPTAYAVLRLGPDHVSYPVPSDPYVSYPAPILWQSPAVEHLNSQLPYVFNLPGKVVLDYAALSGAFGFPKLGYTGVGYGLELYVQDATESYLASSSYQPLYRSQAGSISVRRADIQNNVFIAQYSNVELVCDYE